MQVEVTAKCNHQCTICPGNQSGASDTAEFSHMEEEIFLDLAGSFHLTKMVHLKGWGEPLLHPSFLFMLETVKKAGIQANFTTNGSLLGAEIFIDITPKPVVPAIKHTAFKLGQKQAVCKSRNCSIRDHFSSRPIYRNLSGFEPREV